jgi:hypothetical protein
MNLSHLSLYTTEKERLRLEARRKERDEQAKRTKLPSRPADDASREEWKTYAEDCYEVSPWNETFQYRIVSRIANASPGVPHTWFCEDKLAMEAKINQLLDYRYYNTKR